MAPFEHFWKLAYRILAVILCILAAACALPPAATAELPPPHSETDALLAALRSAGLSAQVQPSETVTFLSETGTMVLANDQPLQVFEYADVQDALAATTQVSSDGATLAGNPVKWAAPPHFYHSGRLVVIYTGTDPAVTTALADVLGSPFAGGTVQPELVQGEKMETNDLEAAQAVVEQFAGLWNRGDPAAADLLTPELRAQLSDTKNLDQLIGRPGKETRIGRMTAAEQPPDRVAFLAALQPPEMVSLDFEVQRTATGEWLISRVKAVARTR